MNMYSKNVSNKSVDIKLNTCTYFFKGLFWCMHSMSGLDVSSNTEINKLERCQQEANGNLFFCKSRKCSCTDPFSNEDQLHLYKSYPPLPLWNLED